MTSAETETGGNATWGAVGRIILYVVAVLTPLMLATALTPSTPHRFQRELGASFALAGFSILVMQFVLIARFKWVERPFGLPEIVRFHKAMGVCAGALLLSHPILVASDARKWSLLTRLDSPWFITLGKIGLLILIIHVVAALLQKALRLNYKKWRMLHNMLAFPLLGLGFVHSTYAGSDLVGWPMKVLWWAMLGVAVLAYGYHRIVRRARALVKESCDAT